MSKVSPQRSSAGGKAGTKARPKGVVDVQSVDIPILPFERYQLGRDALG